MSALEEIPDVISAIAVGKSVILVARNSHDARMYWAALAAHCRPEIHNRDTLSFESGDSMLRVTDVTRDPDNFRGYAAEVHFAPGWWRDAPARYVREWDIFANIQKARARPSQSPYHRPAPT